MAENILIKIFADDRTQAAFKQVGDGFKRMAKASAAMAAAATTAAAVLTVKSMRAADELAKTADKIGATTEALAALQYAGELTGVSVETMNMALQRMTRRVSEAAMGTGEAKAALFELGIDAQKLEQLPLDEQMGIVADAMKGVGSQADRVRIAMKLFDSEGVALVNTLAEGSEGLKQLALEADLLGLSLSRADTAKIEEANDAVLKAKSVFVGFGNQLAVEFAPIITAIATDFRQTALESAEMGNTGQRVARILFQGFGFVGDAIKGLKIIIMGIQLAFARLIETWLSGWSQIGKGIDFVIEKYNTFASALGMNQIPATVSENLEMLSESFGQVADDLQLKIIEALNSTLPSDQIMQWFDEVQAKATETAEVVASTTSGLSMDGEQKTKDEIENQKKLAEFSAMTEREKTKFLIDEANNRFGALGRTSKKMFQVQKALNIAQAMMNTFTGATNALQTLPPPFSFIMAALTVANGMAQVAQIRSQSFEGGGFTGFGARAGGVDGKGGFPAILHPNETVIDHTQGQSAGANVSFNIQANDTVGFDELLVNRRGLIVSMINEALQDQGRVALV
jgi:hypothetical protein